MKIISTLFIILFLCLGCLSQELEIPGDGFSPGWMKDGKALKFIQQDLYNYIDGGSELFLEFGFNVFYVQRYHKGEDELAVEAYQMESPEAALGIYVMKCGKETPIAEISSRNTGDRYQIMILKGNYFIIVNNYSAKESLLPVMVKLANKTMDKITEKKPADLFSILPEEGLIKGSERLIRGPYALQSIYTFGQGDILLLNRKIFGTAADYKDKNGEVSTRILIQYPDIPYAKKAYAHLLANLDTYLALIEEKDNFFSFKDFQQKIGIVTLDKNLLQIHINISEK
jgi:hypothetical protein